MANKTKKVKTTKKAKAGKLPAAALPYSKEDYTHAVEAKSDLLIVLQPCDRENSTPGDSADCAFVHASMRLFGAKHPVFFAQIAYVDLPDKKGKRTLYRYTLPAATQKLIAAFDRGEEVKDASYLLRAPTAARTRAAGRANNDRVRSRTNKRPTSVKPRTPRQYKAHAGRRGTGKVQFHFTDSEQTKRVI